MKKDSFYYDNYTIYYLANVISSIRKISLIFNISITTLFHSSLYLNSRTIIFADNFSYISFFDS